MRSFTISVFPCLTAIVTGVVPLLSSIFTGALCFNNNLITYEIKDNQYIPKLIFSFYDKAYLNETINLIKENHLENYKKYYMLFNEDYASPIFNKNNDEIGYAFLYHPNIPDYKNYIADDNLKALIKLYFNYARFRVNNNELRKGKYFLINPQLLNAYKNYYNYQYLETKLNQNNIAQQIISNMGKGFNNFHDILNDKNRHLAQSLL